MNMMKYLFWTMGSYGSHLGRGFDPEALPLIEGINYRDKTAKNVIYSARLDGIKGDRFKDICISNVKNGLTAKPKKLQWNCTDIEGTTSRVTPPACELLPEKDLAEDCPYPTSKLPIEEVKMKSCSVPI